MEGRLMKGYFSPLWHCGQRGPGPPHSWGF